MWPEGIIPNTYLDELKLYESLFIENFNENHLIGLGISSRSLINENYKYFNSFSLIDNKLNVVQNYNKINLVPFGEFLPFENLLKKNSLKVKKVSSQKFFLERMGIIERANIISKKMSFRAQTNLYLRLKRLLIEVSEIILSFGV